MNNLLFLKEWLIITRIYLFFINLFIKRVRLKNIFQLKTTDKHMLLRNLINSTYVQNVNGVLLDTKQKRIKNINLVLHFVS